jgi:hypothetical protein
MGNIYRYATGVVIWLGTSIPTVIEMLGGRRIESSFFHYLSITCHGNPAAFMSEMEQSLGIFEKFFNLGYWTWLWILQEVLSASDIIVQLRDRVFHWNDIQQSDFHLQDPQLREHAFVPLRRARISTHNS